MDDLIRMVAEAYTHPEEGDADRNGNTRLAVLQERFHLSPLKVQKILVTAGVYEPVKNATAYSEIMRLRKEGRTAKEIMRITGRSAATVSACFPYERAIYNADRSGYAISYAAERKRKQREREEIKRKDAIAALRNNRTDEAFWAAIGENDRMTFVTPFGERYSVSSMDDLSVQIAAGRLLDFPKKDVLAVLHNALELEASGKKLDYACFDQVPVLPYVYPLLVVFGLIPGDRKKFTTRRTLSETAICACCGQKAEYTVRSFTDLIEIAAEIEEEERSRWDPKERERVERDEALLGRVGWDQRRKRDNAAIRAFNKEGERSFCTVCAETIRMALEDGELPHSSAPEDLSDLPLRVAEAGFRRHFEALSGSDLYEDHRGEKYSSDVSGSGGPLPAYFLTEKDREGREHCFACYEQHLPGYRIFEAVEVHKRTKSGKLRRNDPGTDYEFRTGLQAADRDDANENLRRKYIGFLELRNRILDALRNPTLEWQDGKVPIDNAVTIRGRQCSLRSPGEMRVVAVDGPVVQGRKWEGGRYGFKIDGILFTGEEMALMSSSYMEWNLQYRFADPSDRPLRAGEYLMPVQIGEKELVMEVSELLNLFTENGRFISEHDQENFAILFDKTVMKKLKLFYESNPRGYGKLAGMKMIRRLEWIEGTDWQVEEIRELIMVP